MDISRQDAAARIRFGKGRPADISIPRWKGICKQLDKRAQGTCPDCGHDWDSHLGMLDVMCRHHTGGNNMCCCSSDPYAG